METLQQGFDHLPLGDAIKFLSGEDLPLFIDQLSHGDPDDPFWASLDFSPMLATWDVPTLLVDGWQDYQCPQMLDDYVALRAGGTPVWVRIGAGGHIGGGGEGGMTEAPLLWFDTHLMGMTGLLPERTVTLEVLGEGGGWRDFEAWPPPATATPWFLHPGGGLSTDAPTASGHEPDRFRYDPADPTPSVGGIGMLTGGSRDNRELEARPDVLVFTSDVLDRALEIVGPVHADLHVSSSLDHTDFFVRVCDVYPDGRSMNVCDGLQRFTPSTIARASDGSFRAIGGDVADGVPVRARSPRARAGVEWCASGLRAQPRHRRVGAHRDDDEGCGAGRVPRLVGGPACTRDPSRRSDSSGRANARGNPGRSPSQPAPRRAVLPPRKNGSPDRTSVTAGCNPRGWCPAAVRQGLSSR